MGESGQFSWQIVHRDRDSCSKGQENCMGTKCCKTSGYHCYAKDDTTAHCAKRKETGSWVNTGMFIQVWKAIGEANVYQNYDWVVKVDADAVFVPERLQERIQWMPRTTGGTMLQNCQYVDYGFFG